MKFVISSSRVVQTKTREDLYLVVEINKDILKNFRESCNQLTSILIKENLASFSTSFLYSPKHCLYLAFFKGISWLIRLVFQEFSFIVNIIRTNIVIKFIIKLKKVCFFCCFLSDIIYLVKLWTSFILKYTRNNSSWSTADAWQFAVQASV